MMADHHLEQLPLLDGDGRLVDVAFLRHLVEQRSDSPVVLMAGGQGQRLRPLTDETPKPMLPVGDKPLLETVLGQVREAGFGKVLMAVNFQAQVIEEHFGDGEDVGLDISYLHEPHALGSAGALNLARAELDEPFIVMNADLLTNVNLAALLSFHKEDGDLITVGVRRFELEVPYGVVEIEDGQVSSLREKPAFGFFVNAGVYAVQPAAVALMPSELEAFNMTDLVDAALAQRRARRLVPDPRVLAGHRPARRLPARPLRPRDLLLRDMTRQTRPRHRRRRVHRQPPRRGARRRRAPTSAPSCTTTPATTGATSSSSRRRSAPRSTSASATSRTRSAWPRWSPTATSSSTSRR